MTKTSWLVFSILYNTHLLRSPQAECITALEGQIAIEFQASLQYLLMAAHFSQVLQSSLNKNSIVPNFKDTVNLPKVAALFWGHADEEREHAKQFIDYLRMRCNPIFFSTNSWEQIGNSILF